ADAARAEDAAVRRVHHVAAEILDRIEPLGIAIATLGASFAIGIVLKLALAGLIADRAIERVIDEQHLEHAFARLERFVRVDVHHLAFRDRRGAGGSELGRLLDLDQAHATHAGNGKSRVVAIVRDEHTGVLRGLEDRRPRRYA